MKENEMVDKQLFDNLRKEPKMALIRPMDLARMAFSFMNSDQGKQMAEQWIPGILGSALSKKDEAVFDTLHNLLKKLPKGNVLHNAIQQLFNDVLKKHQRIQFRISIISLPLPITKKESWGGEKKDKHATFDVREELNINDQRVKNLAEWANCFIKQGPEETVRQLINKNMISELSVKEQALWIIQQAKIIGSPIWNAVANNNPELKERMTSSIKNTNSKFKFFLKEILLPLLLWGLLINILVSTTKYGIYWATGITLLFWVFMQWHKKRDRSKKMLLPTVIVLPRQNHEED